MRKSYIKIVLTSLFAILSITTTQAQQMNMLYFMKNIAERNLLNPAFQPNYNFYISMPIAFKAEVGNNAVSFKDIIFNQKINGVDSTITFLHPEADANAFIGALPQTTRVNAAIAYSPIAFGFKVKEKNYFNFSITQRATNNLFLPKDLFSLILLGVDTTGSTVYNFDKLGINSTLYTETAFGYSRKINEKLAVGGNLKLLFGQANISTKTNSLSLTAGPDKWVIEGDASINATVPFAEIPVEDGTVKWDDIDDRTAKVSDFFGNWGLGVDLGASYKLLDNLQLSGSITDLGFIRWSKNTVNAGIDGSFEYTGVDYEVGEDNQAKLDSIKERFEDAFSNNAGHNAYTTALSTRLNLGGEYSILNDKIGFGLLSSTLFVNKTAFEDLTASANFRPVRWFSSSLSYSILGGSYSSLGLAMQVKAGPMNFYFLADQVPLSFSTRNYIPRDLRKFNFQFGLSVCIGNPDKAKTKKDKGDSKED